METYSNEIVNAYNNWMAKIELHPSDQYHENYKKAVRNSNRAGDKFEKICKAKGLNYVKVASQLCQLTIIG